MSDYKRGKARGRWSDYKVGKTNSEFWAQRFIRMVEAAGASTNPLADIIDYKTRVAKDFFSSSIPRGVQFSDPMLIKTHQIIMTKLPIWQREDLFAFLFSEEKVRETGDIRSVYERIGRELRDK